jgi:hypothetical protein
MPIPVIVYGNPCDGISVIGPFESLEDATDWAEENLDEADGNFFWPTPLFLPDEFISGKNDGNYALDVL